MNKKIIVITVAGILIFGIFTRVTLNREVAHAKAKYSFNQLLSRTMINTDAKDYKSMIEMMENNGLKDLGEAMKNGDYNAMNKIMSNMSEEDYKKMIDVMKQNGYTDMARMMESVGREGMLRMHNVMGGSQSCHGNQSENFGMMRRN